MPITSDDLASRVLAYDGQHTDTLEHIAQDHGDEPGYETALVPLCGSDNELLATGASWLVLKYVKDGGQIDVLNSEMFAGTLTIDGPWQHTLHVCQAIGVLNIGKNVAVTTQSKLTELAQHKRPFVRAWALDASVALARIHGEACETTVRAMLARAANDPAASVRARVRKLKI